ncbi:Lrp/AsnC family transcriptional regulator [Streptomyces sp. NPDC088261]|uniref:Lrp/AsnC family transcriptional regulator n=1 Tax=Streptomyces sp. NPDC088261 TaxID=3365851 RepID=UPI0037F47ACF
MGAEQMAEGTDRASGTEGGEGAGPTPPPISPPAPPPPAPPVVPPAVPPALPPVVPLAVPPAALPPRPLDAIDRDILRILRADGRASVRSVAERVHVSRANAYARINRLIDDGVIRGFSARVNEERAGQGASAYITLKIVQNSWRTVREQLQGLPGATHIALVSGDFDVLLLVHTADNRTLRELVLTRLQAIPEVLSTRTLLVFEETDLDQGPPGPQAPPPRAPL